MKTFMDITEMFSFLLMIKNVCKTAYATFFFPFFFLKTNYGGDISCTISQVFFVLFCGACLII